MPLFFNYRYTIKKRDNVRPTYLKSASLACHEISLRSIQVTVLRKMNKYKDFRNEHKGPEAHHILLSIQDDVDGATGEIGTSTNIRGTGT